MLAVLCCPACGSSLERQGADLVCKQHDHFPVIDGIPRLLAPSARDPEERFRSHTQSFYEQHPFPGYDDVDSPSVLIAKARASGFGHWVDRAISPLATVLEVGCGTGQLTNFLGLVGTRTVIGIDQCIPSLSLGEGFRRRSGLQNVLFVQGNVYALPVRPQSIDVVYSSGMLPVTADPRLGFHQLVNVLKPGGKIVVGLYNRYARIPQGLRKLVFRVTGKTAHWIDPRLRRAHLSDERKDIWFADQYLNPYERWHSVDQILAWFEEAGVTYLSAVPPLDGADAAGEELPLFTPHARGSHLTRLLRQLGWMFTIGREGGLFVLVGERTAAPAPAATRSSPAWQPSQATGAP